MKKTTFFIILAFFISSVSVASTQSATLVKSSLTAIPPRLGDDLSLKIKPGEKIQTSIRVRNSSSQALTVKSLAQDFIVDLDGETPIAIKEEVSNRWSLASWLILTPSVQVIQPGEIKLIHVTIEAPVDALAGGHYAMITHQPSFSLVEVGLEVSVNPKSAAILQQRVGTLLYVVVDGVIDETSFIRELTFPKFTEYGPVPFSFTVDNQSDIHITPQIGVEIYNLFGKKVESIEMPAKNIFPFIPRELEGEWNRTWGFGPYAAKVIMSYGTTGQLAIATTSFWLLPITILLAILILLLAITIITIATHRHLQHRRKVQQAKTEVLGRKISQLQQEKLQKFEN